MDELLSQFLLEGRDLIADAQAALSALRDEPSNAVQIDRAFRAFHTLKGSVAIFAMAPAERVLHAAEDLLQRARAGHLELTAEEIGRLVATIDQVDRWVDEMEAHGALGKDAAGIATGLLDADAVGEAGTAARPATAMPAWADEMMAREVTLLAEATGPLIAFCYKPDSEAFFRGDDPLSLVASVPELAALSILPSGDAWPEADAIDPFACFMRIEGISAAPLAVVQAAFRLVPDQIELHQFEIAADNETSAGVQVAATLRVEAARVRAGARA